MAVVERARKPTQVLPEQFCPPLDPAGNTAHYWDIDKPEGPISLGRCRMCGSEREFRNSASDHIWETNNPQPGKTWRTDRQIRMGSNHSNENDVE